MPRIGIDLGGTKIEGIVLAADGRELARHRVPTPAGQYQATLDCIADLVAALEADTGVRAPVGVGTPGALSPATGLLRNSNSTCLNGRPLDQDLAARLQRPVRIANDANCFALSEAIDGAAAGAHCIFGVILGTGTGGGLVVSGQVWQGRHAIAGEWGHNPLPWPQDDERPGPTCYCGKQGCIETFLSGPGLLADYQGQSRPASARELVSRADHDPAAEACLRRYADRLARALASVINVIDPDVIVLGGGLSQITRLYQEVPERWSRYVFSEQVTTPLRPPVHGDSSGVRGAAWLWPESATS
jgi:fructokinase